MQKISGLLAIMVLGYSANLACAAEDPPWQAFDESTDLARLAQHPNEDMHFRLLQSKVVNKNQLWLAFNDVLENFSAQRYASLAPLIVEKSVVELQDAIAQSLFSYEELATFYIYRLREVESDPERYLNAVISLLPDALEQARAADATRLQGREISRESLFGMPVLLKDNIGASGVATTAGALALQNNLSADAFITSQLKAAGAVILGKANLSEWAYFFCQSCPSGYSALGGQTLNPYGRFDFGTGGSSSGSGVAVAANLAVVTVGSETSGSILSPASSNSAVGLKPTTGSLSRSGVVPISSTLDTAGPITRTVSDAALLFNAMAGFDQRDTAMPMISDGMQLQLRDVPLMGKRLGVLTSYTGNALYAESLSLFSANDAELVDVTLSDFDSNGFGELLGGDMQRDLASYLEQWASAEVSVSGIAEVQEFNNEDPDIRVPYGQALVDMMAELELSDEELAELRERLQGGARQVLDEAFIEQNLDVLLSINNYSAGIAALANYPALTIPMGYTEEGRPMGLTLIAPSFQEQALIDIGLQFERLSAARRLPADYQ